MIIGVTGGIASGKSEVCRILEKNGFFHIDADEIAHIVLEFPEVINKITAEFGNCILSTDREKDKDICIDRGKLGKIVFNDPEKMNRLENITHPRIIQQIHIIINEGKSKNYVIEAIEIVKSGLINICDELWVVHVEPEQQMKRLIENRGLSLEEAEARLKSQEEHDWDESKADRIIYSTEPIETMEKQVYEALSAAKHKSQR